jgi:protein-tyrosine phosphatase
MDPSFRSSTGRWLACVFPDLDGPLASSNRVAEVVQLTLDTIASGGDAPERVYVMCQHGMNRSGLVAGLLLRGLGVEPRETVERIRRARPGALANDHFRLMVLGHA